MAKLIWDKTGERFYETGVDRGVLYPQGVNGIYPFGVPWNGLTAVTESPSGAESNKQYADNIVYLNLISAEEYSGTIEAYQSPIEFDQCDGSASPAVGVSIGQQHRKPFGFSYRTKLGNDTTGQDYGYKIHLVYGAQAAPSERAYATVNDSPEATTLSWEISTTPVEVGVIGGVEYKPTATLTIDSTKVDALDLKALEDTLYGTETLAPRLPLPSEVIAMFEDDRTVVTTVAPSFVAATGVITIPVVTGVTYRRADNNNVVTGTVTISPAGASLTIRATPTNGTYVFSPASDDDWVFTRDA